MSISMTEVTNIHSELSPKTRRMETNGVHWQSKVKLQQPTVGCLKQPLPVKQVQLTATNTAIPLRRMLSFRFKEEHSFEQRLEESNAVRKMYPDRLPIVVAKMPGSSIDEPRKAKFLVPDSICADQFIWILKEKLSYPFDKEIRIYINNQQTSPDSDASLREIFSKYKDDDGFLYVAYCDFE